MDSTSRHMNKSKAVELLKQLINGIPHLRTLNYKNHELISWLDRVKNVLSLAFDDNDYQKFVNAKLRSDMRLMGDEVHHSNYQYNLTTRKTILQSIVDKHEILGTETKSSSRKEPKDAVKSPIDIFDAIQFHPQVVEASRKLFEDGHYRDAIYRAFVEVNNLVKRKAKSQLDGRKLMSTVFSPENPIIKLNPLETQTDKDEQEGFMYLFMGAMQGIRNPKAHENIIQNNPYIAVKLIGFASLLIETIAFWKAEDT